MTMLLAHGMDDQKLPSSIIMISFNPSQMSCSFAADLVPCCQAGAGAGDAAFDPQFSWRLSGSGCGGRRWCVEAGAQEGAGAGAAAAAAAAAAWAAGKLSLAR